MWELCPWRDVGGPGRIFVIRWGENRRERVVDFLMMVVLVLVVVGSLLCCFIDCQCIIIVSTYSN